MFRANWYRRVPELHVNDVASDGSLYNVDRLPSLLATAEQAQVVPSATWR
jgi:hypothetical protein